MDHPDFIVKFHWSEKANELTKQNTIPLIQLKHFQITPISAVEKINMPWTYSERVNALYLFKHAQGVMRLLE